MTRVYPPGRSPTFDAMSLKSSETAFLSRSAANASRLLWVLSVLDLVIKGSINCFNALALVTVVLMRLCSIREQAILASIDLLWAVLRPKCITFFPCLIFFIFTPIKNVKYDIEDYRVEQKTDYEKLVFEIETDGSIHPKDALTEAAKILIHHFMLFSDELITLEADEIAQSETYDEESLHMRQLLKTKLVDMDLSVRALNCLKAAEVDTLGDLVSFNKNDLMKFRNFGRKSLTELEELVILKGLSFGMELTKYKLDKD